LFAASINKERPNYDPEISASALKAYYMLGGVFTVKFSKMVKEFFNYYEIDWNNTTFKHKDSSRWFIA
jgi:hypothetical protein